MSDPSPLTLGLDVTSLLDRPTGVGLFTRAVLDGVAQRADVEVHPFAVSLRGTGRLEQVVPQGLVTHRPVMPARVARAAWRRWNLPTARWLAGTVDVVHGPNFVVPPGGGAAEIVTVHDLTAVHHPGLCTPDVLQWPALMRRALARGAWIHTVSAFVADEVREAFPEAGERVVPVSNGHSPPPPVTPRSDAPRGRHLAGRPRYVLAIGTVEPRKDLPGLVAAFDSIAGGDEELGLVIAGPDGWGAPALTEEIDRAAHRRRIRRLGWVDDETRWALMRGASVVAYPSRYEGFGLVPLDSMAVDTPVVATAAGAIPEVVGDAARLVEVGDVSALAGALSVVLNDEAVARQLVEAGRRRLGRFRWESTVDGLVDLYRRSVEA